LIQQQVAHAPQHQRLTGSQDWADRQERLESAKLPPKKAGMLKK